MRPQATQPLNLRGKIMGGAYPLNLHTDRNGRRTGAGTGGKENSRIIS